jgi:hypothetical protein
MLKLLQNLAFFSQRDKNATIFAHHSQRERELAQSWIALFLLRLSALSENFSGPAELPFQKARRAIFPHFRQCGNSRIIGRLDIRHRRV